MHNKIILLLVIFSASLSNSQSRFVDNVFKNIEVKTYCYAIKSLDTLKLDIYQPEKDNLQKRPLFVIIHGGGFSSGRRNVKSIVSLATNIAKKGYVVVSIDYRLSEKNDDFNCNASYKDALNAFSKAGEDVLDALLYLKKYKRNFKIDETKTILFGVSAGAETAMNITYNRELLIKNTKKYKYLKIAGIISISGAILNSDLINYKNTTPAVLFHGMKDAVVPYSKNIYHSCNELSNGCFLIDGSERIAQKLDKINTSFMLYLYKNKGHDIFNLPYEDFHEAFEFIKNVALEHKFQQTSITK